MSDTPTNPTTNVILQERLWMEKVLRLSHENTALKGQVKNLTTNLECAEIVENWLKRELNDLTVRHNELVELMKSMHKQ